MIPEGGTFRLSSDDGLAVARIGDALGWVALRNAPLERARGFLPVPNHRAWGPDDAVSSTRALLRFGPPAAKEHVLGGFRATGGELLAVKRAEDGRGVIARIEIESGLARMVVPWPVASAWTCDARERDLAPLEVTGEELRLPVGRGPHPDGAAPAALKQRGRPRAILGFDAPHSLGVQRRVVPGRPERRGERGGRRQRDARPDQRHGPADVLDARRLARDRGRPPARERVLACRSSSGMRTRKSSAASRFP